jgi:outer membrane protein TolC
MVEFQRHISVVLLSSLLAVTPLIAGSSGEVMRVTVDELVEMARSRDPGLLGSEARREAALAARAAVGQWPHPELSTEWERLQGGDGEDAWGYEVALSQTIASGRKNAAARAMADRQMEAQALVLEKTRVRLAADVRSLACAAWQWGELNERARQLLSEAESLLAPYRQRSPSGAVQELERLQVEARTLNFTDLVLDIRRQAADAMAELALLVGTEPEPGLEIIPFEIDVPRRDAGATNALNPPEVALRTKEVGQAELAVRNSRLANRPEWAVGVFHRDEGTADGDRAAGLTVSVPLPLWSVSRGIEAEARALHAEALAGQQRAEREAAGTWGRYNRAAQHHLVRLDLYSVERLDAMRATTERARQQFAAGAISASAYLEAQQTYLEAMARRREAVVGAYQAYVNMRYQEGLQP